MSNNIAFIIPSSNFSGSPLGKISIPVDVDTMATNIANGFATKIGSSSYNTQIKAMVKSMIEQDLWDSCVYLYPCVGNNLSSLKQNLVDGGAMILHANASAGTNEIVCRNDISVGDTTDEAPYGEPIPMNKYCQIVRAIFPKKSVNTSTLCTSTPYGRFQALTNATAGYRCVNARLSSTSTLFALNAQAEETHTYTLAIEGNDEKLYVDGLLSATETFTNTLADSNVFAGYGYDRTRNTGTSEEGASIASSGDIFNGSLSFACIGRWGVAESEKMNAIVNAFVASLNK